MLCSLEIVVAIFCKLLLSDDVLNASIGDNDTSDIIMMDRAAENTGSISILIFMLLTK
jgi:hypothetical protein